MAQGKRKKSRGGSGKPSKHRSSSEEISVSVSVETPLKILQQRELGRHGGRYGMRKPLARPVTGFYTQRLSQMAVTRCQKLLPDAYFCLEWHPTHPALLFVGDKWGKVAAWNYDVGQVSTAQDMTNPVTDLRFTDPSSFFTSSYDGTVQQYECGTLVATQLVKQDVMLTCLDAVPGSSSCVVGDEKGSLLVIDRRAPSPRASYVLHDLKISGVSINGADPNLIATASNEHCVALWDARKLSSRKTRLGLMHLSGLVNSAVFSPDGTRLLIATRDDAIRIVHNIPRAFDLPPDTAPHDALCTDIYHNNNTGRWIRPFKAQWDPKSGALFAIGDMDSVSKNGEYVHRIQVYHGPTGRHALDMAHANLSSISPINKFHPSQDAVASAGNTKVFIWQRPDDCSSDSDDSAVASVFPLSTS